MCLCTHKQTQVHAKNIFKCRKLIAVSEKGERPSVTLYDATTLKKKRQIMIPADRDVPSTEFAAVAFTFDSKMLITVTGEPDWALYAFKCDKGKLETSTRANNNNGTGIINQVNKYMIGRKIIFIV